MSRKITQKPNYSKFSIAVGVEIDNYLLGKTNSFESVQEFRDVLVKYQLKDSDDALSMPNFPYVGLHRAMHCDEKPIRKIDELALEMRLLRMELRNVEELNQERLETLRDFFIGASKEFMYTDDEDRLLLMVA